MFDTGLCLSSVVVSIVCMFFFFKQKTAYEMRISDWSSDVCSSDLIGVFAAGETRGHFGRRRIGLGGIDMAVIAEPRRRQRQHATKLAAAEDADGAAGRDRGHGYLPLTGFGLTDLRSEEHTSELQSLIRISYAVFLLPKTITI